MTTAHPHKTCRENSWDEAQEEALKRHHANSNRHSAFNLDKHTEKTMITAKQLIDTSVGHAQKGASNTYERIQKRLLEVVKNDNNPGSYEWMRLQGLLEQALREKSTTKVEVFRSVRYRVDADPFGYPLPPECVPTEDEIKKFIHKDLLPVFAGWEWSSDPKDGCMIYKFDWSNQVKERLRELENDEPPEDGPQPKKQKQDDDPNTDEKDKKDKNDDDDDDDGSEGEWHVQMPGS
jgi:hypothetical protein